METHLKWEKDIFSNLYNIYSNGQQIGKLKDKAFSQSANGELNGREYTFKTKGFFKPHTEIVDDKENKVIGQITYNNWMTKATISVDNKTINWKYDNLWATKWSVFNSEGIRIQYTSSLKSGQINSNIDDALLLLSGLYVTNYYRHMTVAVLVAAFVPIWTTLLR